METFYRVFKTLNEISFKVCTNFKWRLRNMLLKMANKVQKKQLSIFISISQLPKMRITNGKLVCLRLTNFVVLMEKIEEKEKSEFWIEMMLDDDDRLKTVARQHSQRKFELLKM